MNRKLSERPSRTSALAFLVASVLAATASAAQQPPQTPAPTTESRAGLGADQPPVITFPAEGITLEEAVRLTLQHEPGIKLREAAARFQEGVAQEQSGAFDVSLLGNVQYTYRVQELTENRKQAERDKRDRLRSAVEDNRSNVQQAEKLLGQLQQVRDAAPGSAQVKALKDISPALGAQLEVIDALIASASSATRSELLSIRQDFINRTLADIQQGLGQEVDQFHTNERRLIQVGAAPDDEVFYNGSVNVQFAKLFRTGISLAPFFDASLEGANFKGKGRSVEFGGKGLEDLFTFNTGVNLTLPLARNRGAEAAGAPERAAFIEREASRLALDHQAAVSALNTVQAYWDVRAAQETVAIAMRSVDLQTKLVEMTRGLIEAEELPQSELARVQASEARSRARLQDAQRRLHQARVALATVMGVAVTDDDATLPRARDQFPPQPALGAVEEPQVAPLGTEALDRRRDLSAAARREEAGLVLERSAVVNLRPRFDLVASTWYTALEERAIAKAVDRWVGPSTNLSLQLEKPVGNNSLRGQLVQREADTRQRRITSEDLKRQIRLGVTQTVRSLREVIGRVQQAQAAVDYYQRTVEAEVERFKIGESTLIDTVLTEQQRTEATLQLAAAQQELAQLVAQLRFETGTLITDGQVAPENLVTVPSGVRREP